MQNDQIPRAWLMTDARIGNRLWLALERLPTGAGVVLRHDQDPERATVAHRIAEVAARRGLILSVAGDVALARSVGARFTHRPHGAVGDIPFSLPVHTLEEAVSAAGRGASFVFVSPIAATATHPGMPSLGLAKARLLAHAAGLPAIALGGMDAAEFDRRYRGDFHGWAGIDAWLRI